MALGVVDRCFAHDSSPPPTRKAPLVVAGLGNHRGPSDVDWPSHIHAPRASCRSALPFDVAYIDASYMLSETVARIATERSVQ